MPWVAKRRHKTKGESQVWGAILDRVLKRPLLSAILAGGLLRRADASRRSRCTPSTRASTGLPRDLEVMQAYDKIQAAFPGGNVPAVTVVKAADVTTPEVEGGDRGPAASRRSPPASSMEPSNVEINPDKTVATVTLGGQGHRHRRARRSSRSPSCATTWSRRRSASCTAPRSPSPASPPGSKDFNDVMKSHLPIVFAFVLTLAFILLLVTFRSIVVPIKAIVLNLLSVGAAYGILKLVFQDGRLEGVLDYQSVGGITSWLPLFLFVILFGLSMDYHVFILSRIREAVDEGMRTDEAVAHGIKSTAGVVTSAAAVMVAVFAIFATLSHARVQADGRRPRGRRS